MAITFKNVQHALATFFKAVAKDTPLVLAKTEQVLEAAENDKTEVEAVSAVAAGAIGGAAAVAPTITVENAAFAALASIVAALKAGGAAAASKLLDAGLDQTAIYAAEAAGTASAAVYTTVMAASK
jgi:hypothetical protein